MTEEILKEKDGNAQKRAELNKLKIELAKLKMVLSTKDVDIALLNEQVVGLQNKQNIKSAPLVRAKKNIVRNNGNTQIIKLTAFTGTLFKIKTKSSYITHALVDSKRKPLCYVHFTEPAAQFERTKITIKGTVKSVKGWRVPILNAVNIAISK